MSTRVLSAALLTLWTAGAYRAQAAVTVTATPTSVNFTYQIGAALPNALLVQVKASSGTPAFTTAITPPTALWVAASPDAGALNASVSVFVNPTGLAVGNYAANVTVTVAGVGAPLTIPVNLVVTAPLPMLTMSANALTFAAPPSPSTSQTVTLTTTSGPVPFTAVATNVPWMTVTPSSGVVLPGGPVTLNIAISLTVHSVTPTLVSLWPGGARPGSPASTITIRGTGFSPLSVVTLQGVPTPLKVTYISPTVLEAVILAPQLAAAATLDVLVTNPAPGGPSAGTLPFVVGNTPVISAAVNAASYSATSVSPGVLMTMFGTSIGPIAPAFMQDTSPADGFVDTTLGGVSVTVDGVDAPMIYASQNQVTVQVPYAATVGLAKAIVLTNGALTANGTVDIAATGPGVFALNGSGAGPAAALNFNATTLQYTINSTSNAAKIGDTVVLYITGEGDYATAITPRTGLLITPALTPLPQVSPLPDVTIGGAAATVTYAGPFAGSLLGVLEIDCVIGAGSQTGAAVPVEVAIGGNNSQTGVTLAVKP
jgi:uncharacterized protein (TIGR03437 family)